MSTYRTIHTAYGLAAMAQAEAAGTPINITHMAVGDGNGNDVTPSESQTALVRELFRAAPNRVYQDPTTPNRFTAELVIPATAGGFVLREIGVFDATGSLFVVGNLPATYKPQASEGAFADTVVRVDFMVTNASVVTLQVDPNVAVATQQWVSNNVTACALLPGGTTGQVLRKSSNACGDVEWSDPTEANVVVDVIEETQTLALNQTAVILSVVTTRGLAVYIDGLRIPHASGAGGWQPDATDPDDKIVLGNSYPAGTQILLTQNEPAGSVPYPLVRDLNLADLQNKATARANLDVYSRAEVRNMIPPGIVDHYAGETPPSGWLVRDGSAISRTVYADLFARLGTRFGPGDGFNTFNLPDDRDLFDRGWGGASSGRALGSYQADRMQDHYHGTGDFQGEGNDDWWAIVRGWAGTFASRWVAGESGDNRRATIIGGTTGTRYTGTTDQMLVAGTETRPKNRAYLPIIKF